MFTLIEFKLLDLQLIPSRPGIRMRDDHLMADLGLDRAELRRARKTRR